MPFFNACLSRGELVARFYAVPYSFATLVLRLPVCRNADCEHTLVDVTSNRRGMELRTGCMGLQNLGSAF